jgi:hypothetical protein
LASSEARKPASCERGARENDLARQLIAPRNISHDAEAQALHDATRDGAVRSLRRRAGNAEASVQAAIVEWIRTVAPELIVFHPPNGGLRGKAEAARLKWIGTLAGIPDLVVLGRDGRTWLIEVKAENGTLSVEQRAIRDRCTAMRIPFVVARSIDDVRQAFALWAIETREATR